MVFSVMRRMRYQYCGPSFDNFIFKLCYRWTVLLLIVFSFIITSKLWFGDSIVCLAFNAVDKYSTVKCYNGHLYHLPALWQKDEYSASKDATEDKRHYMTYYSWVNLLLLVHAFMFYVPHLLWKSYERGYMYKLTAGFQKYLDKEEKRDLELSHLAKYVFTTQGKHKLYTLLYILFEILNFVISLSNTLWLTYFFNIIRVPDSIPYTLNTWSDFRNFYFPDESFCNYRKIGASGDFQRHQSLCLLPLNSLYMKIYLFLNAWYITLTVLTALMIIYRVLLLIPSVRTFISKISSPLSATSILKSVCYQQSYNDWFFLSRFQYAMTDIDFAHMVDKIVIISQGKDPESDEYKRFNILNDISKEPDNLNITSTL